MFSKNAKGEEAPREQGKRPAPHACNIWESPPQKPVRGVVQPRVVPPLGKPTRRTNQLDSLMEDVLRPLMRHENAWPFVHPVDTIKLNIPDYHDVIERPMDLNSIARRLENTYYFSAEECIKDFERVFENCYQYNNEGSVAWTLCEALERDYRNRISYLPTPEVQLTRSMLKRRFGEESVVMKRPRKQRAPSHNRDSTAHRFQSRVHTGRGASILKKEPLDEESTDIDRTVDESAHKHEPCVPQPEDTERRIVTVQDNILSLEKLEDDISTLEIEGKDAKTPNKPAPELDTSKAESLKALVTVPDDLSIPCKTVSDPAECSFASAVTPNAEVDTTPPDIHRQPAQEDFTEEIDIMTPEGVPTGKEQEVSSELEGNVAQRSSAETGKGKTDGAELCGARKKRAKEVQDVSLRSIRKSKRTKARDEQKRRQTVTVDCEDRQLSVKEQQAAVQMTCEEKRKLALDISRLPFEKLITVVSIVKTFEAPPEGDGDVVEFDIEHLKPITLHYLEHLVSSSLRKQPRKPYTPKSQEDVDKRKRELMEKIKGLGGSVSAVYPRIAPPQRVDREDGAMLSESSSSEDQTSESGSLLSSTSSLSLQSERKSHVDVDSLSAFTDM